MSDIRVMNELDMISLKNLMLLSKNRDNEEFRWFVERAEIKSVYSDNDSYDTGNTCSDLEYPCLLMFHQLFRFLDDSNRIRFKKYSQREIMRLMEHSLESLFQVLNASDEPNEDKERLACLLKECDDKHSFYHEFYNSESICTRLGVWLAETLDQVVESFSESHRYLDLTPMTLDLGNSSDTSDDNQEAPDDSESESGDEGSSYSEPKKEC